MSLGHQLPDSVGEFKPHHIHHCKERAANAYRMAPETQVAINPHNADQPRFHVEGHEVGTSVTMPLWVLVAKYGTSYQACKRCFGGGQ